VRRRAGPQGGAPSTASPAGQGRRRGRRARAHTAPRWPSSTSGWRGSTASTLRWHYARCVRQCRSRSRAPTPDALRERASGLGLPLFDKLEFERLLDWVERQAAAGAPRPKTVACGAPFDRRRSSSARCGYGIVSSKEPDHCPMCGESAAWAAPPLRLRAWTTASPAWSETTLGGG
jgi:hypothetical protein